MLAALPEQAPRTLQRSRNVKRLGVPREMSRFARLATTADFAAPAGHPLECPPVIARIPLPPPRSEATTDLGAALRQRSSGIDHVIKPVLDAGELSTLCAFASAATAHDLATGPARPESHLYCVINRVASVDPGVYRYDPEGHALDCLALQTPDAQYDALQHAYRLSNINMAGAAVALFVVHDYAVVFGRYGNRGFRIVNLEAGTIAGRLYIATGWLGLGCHAILGFRGRDIAALLGLRGDAKPLLGVLIGAPKTSRVSVRLPLWI
jgi:SagB-type dehydrogenase family enzyme